MRTSRMDAQCAMQKAERASCRIRRVGISHASEQITNDTGEPCAVKAASTVRGGAVGNVPAMATRLPPTLPKMEAPLAIVWSRPLPLGVLPSRVTITKDSAERYFISILLEEDIPHLPQNDASLGADLGLKSFVVLS